MTWEELVSMLKTMRQFNELEAMLVDDALRMFVDELVKRTFNDDRRSSDILKYNVNQLLTEAGVKE